MKYLKLLQFINYKDIRNAIFGIIVVFGGLCLALITLYAHQTGNVDLAGNLATVSLVFVALIFIFVIPPLARSASAEASQMNLPFEVTNGGLIFFCLMIIVGVSAWNTGNNLLFLVLSFLLSTLVISSLIGHFCLKKLDVKMRFPETIFAREATPINVSLHNKKRIFPAFSIVAEIRGKEREILRFADEFLDIFPEKWRKKLFRAPVLKHTLDYFIHVPRYGDIHNRAEHFFPRRGKFMVKDFELSTKFPFGFLRHRRRLPAKEAEIIIFPKIEKLSPDLRNLPLQSGNLTLQKRGSGQDLLTLREYQPTDDLRHVDWKATARSRNLIVREFAAEDEKRITIFFDERIVRTEAEKKVSLGERIRNEQAKDRKLTESEEKFEKGVSQAASLLTYFVEEQAEVRLIIGDELGDFGVGKTHLFENLKRLALVEPIFAEDNFDFLSDLYSEIFTPQENSYKFVVTSKNERNLPPEIVQNAAIIKF